MPPRPNKRLKAEARLYDSLRKANDLTEAERGLLDSLGGIEGVKAAADALGQKAGKEMNQDAEIAAAVAALKQADIFVLDLETVGTTGEEDAALDPLTNRIEGVGVGVGTHKNEIWWFPFIPSHPGEQVFSQVQVFRALEPILKDPNKSFLNSNPKFDIKCLMAQGLVVRNKIIDTVIADWLLDENQKRHGLKEIVEREFGLKTVSWAEAKAQDATQPGAFAEYARNDVKYAFMVWKTLGARLEREPRLKKLFHEVEMEIIPAFAEVELSGMKVDRKYLTCPDSSDDPTKGTGLLQILEQEKREANERAQAALGRSIDLSKSQQVSVVLFGVPTIEALREAKVEEKVIERLTSKSLFEADKPLFPIPLDKKRKPLLPGKNGYYSTDDGILSYIKGSPFIDALLDYRWADKLISTYVTSFLQKSERTGGVHPDFNLAGAVTGRFCVSDKTILETSVGICRISELDLTNKQEITIITHRGRPRKILGVYFLGREEMFRVTLDNGSSIEGTAGHRVETPYGWRSIYELSEGEEVFSPRDQARKSGDKREALRSAGRCFQKNTGRGHSGKGSPSEVPNKPTRLVHVKSPLQGQIRDDSQVAAPEQVSKSSHGQSAWRTPAIEDYSQGRSPKDAGCRIQPSFHIQKVWNERIHGSQEHHTSRPGEVGGATEKNTVNGHGNYSVVGRALSWTSGSIKALQRKTPRILRGIVHSLCKACSTVVVRSILGEQLSLSEGGSSNTQKSHNMEHEQGGITAVARTSRRGDSPSAAAFYREIHGGLCISGGKIGSGGGRGVSQDRQSDTEAGRKEGSSYEKTWVENSEIYNKTGTGENIRSAAPYPEATIVSIESVGEQDIWDIEVEEDHSFIANGFVNHNTCSNPSLHQIPTEKGKYSIKKSFIPSPGCEFICGDYGQIQFKLAGHFALKVLGKSKIAEAYLAGIDLHTKTQTELNLAERKPAKTINFGFIFGRMPDGFSYDNHIPIGTAKDYYNRFHRAYPELDQMYDWVKEQLCEKGYVTSLVGRKRRFPQYKGKDPKKQSGGLWWDSRSTAWNAMIQGSEADIVRIAIRNIHREIVKRRETNPLWNKVKLKVQVHDEMVYEVPKEIVEEAAAMIKERAETCVKLSVPISFDVGISANNWEEAKK